MTPLWFGFAAGFISGCVVPAVIALIWAWWREEGCKRWGSQ